MPIFDHSAEGSLSLAELGHMQASYKDAQLIKSLKLAGVSARSIKKSMAALAAKDPLTHMRLALALERNRVLVSGQIDQRRLQELIKAGREHRDLQERFENSYWGGIGKVAAFTKKHSPAALMALALKQQFGKDGVYARNLTTMLRTAGNSADDTRTSLLSQSVEFAAMEANITEQLARYGLDHRKAGKMTEEYTRYFGHNAALAKQVMARLAGTAKMANVDVGELWNIVIEQQREYGRGAMQTAVDLHLNLKLFRGVANELTSNHMYASYMSGDRDQTIWPQLMTESLQTWHKAFGKTGTNLKMAGQVVAEAYRQAAKHGTSQEKVRREADAYVHLARGTNWMRARVGLQTLEMIERKVKETQAAKAGLSWEEASREVLLARYGEDQLAVATQIFDLYARGDRAHSPEALVKLDESLDKTMMGVVQGTQQQWQEQSNDAIYMHMVHLGVEHSAAAGTVLTVRAGGLAQAQKHNAHLTQSLDNNRRRLKESADFLVDTDITSTTSIQRVMAMAQRFIATPLGKLAAALGVFWAKLALDGYYKLKMILDWFRAGFAYARMAGLTSATGLVAFLKTELTSAGMIAADLRALAGSAARIALPTMAAGAAAYSVAGAAEWRIKEANAQTEAMKVAAGATNNQRQPPKLTETTQLGRPDDLLTRYSRSELAVPATLAAGTRGPAAFVAEQLEREAPQLKTILTAGGVRHPTLPQQPLLLMAQQQQPQPPWLTADTGTPPKKPVTPPETRLVQYQPRSEREAALVASGIPLTSTGRIAISALAQLESSRRQTEFRNLWLSAMGGDLHTSETGRAFVRCRFEGFAQLVAGVPIRKAQSVTNRTG